MARRRKKARRHAGASPNPPKPGEFSNRPLADLDKLASSPSEPGRPSPRSEPQPTGAEPGGVNVGGADEFAQAMAGVKPLDSTPILEPPEPKLPIRPPAAEQEEAEVLASLQELVSGELSLSIHQTDESIEGLAEGIDPNLLRRLKRGEFSVQDHLDLHGTTREEARPIVVQFLTNAIARGLRCVLVIHGRGHGSKDKIPVLKLALKTWLLRSGIRKAILGFSTALPCDGGGGALYVLLRKQRRV